MYQTTVNQEDRVGDDHEGKTFRTSVAPPSVKNLNIDGVGTILSIHATPKVRDQRSEKDSWEQIAALKALRDAEGKFKMYTPKYHYSC